MRRNAFKRGGRTRSAWLIAALLLAVAGSAIAAGSAVAYPFTQTPPLISQDGTANEKFGTSVAISGDGNTVAVGAPGANSNAGSVQIFVRGTGDTWSRQTRLVGSNTGSGPAFGSAVSLSTNGNHLIVGAPGNNSAVVYTRTGTAWAQSAVLNPVSNAYTDFGTSVSMDGTGTRAVVGGPTTDYMGTKSGRAFVFAFTTTWNQEATLGWNPTYPGSYLGDSVAIDSAGTEVIVGSPGSTTVRFFTRSGTSWSETDYQSFLADDPGRLGDAVDISADGNFAAVGAPTTSSSKGSMFPLRDPDTGGWTTQYYGASTPTGTAPDDLFGSAVAVSGDGSLMIAGAPGANGPGGKIFTYEKVESFPYTYWTASQVTGNPDQTAGDQFGASVDISNDGNTAVIGAPGADRDALTDRGKAFILQDPNYTLTVNKTGPGTVSSTPAGINCGSTCSAPMDAGQTVTLTATPSTGYTFGGWTGACTGTGSCQVTMTSNKTVSAFFNPLPGSITIQKQGTGTVTSNPPGIDCGSSCTGAYLNGTYVNLIATPADDTTFQDWGGACAGFGDAPVCSITVEEAKTVTAKFSTSERRLTVNLAGSGNGRVASSVFGLNCYPNYGYCMGDFTRGTTLTLSPTPDSKSVFDGWAGKCFGYGSCQVTLDNDTILTANFKSKPAQPSEPNQPDKNRIRVCGTLPGYGAFAYTKTKGISCGQGTRLAGKARRKFCRTHNRCATGPPYSWRKTYRGKTTVNGWRCRVMVKDERSQVYCRRGNKFALRSVGS